MEFLKLKHCSIGNQGFTELLSSKHLRRLKILLLSKNLISKMTLPFDDLRSATKLQLNRELMNLDLLDLRENQITTLKSTTYKFLKSTVVLAWDNPLSDKVVEGMLGKPKIYSGLVAAGESSATGAADGFNPFIVIKPNEEQKKMVEMM